MIKEFEMLLIAKDSKKVFHPDLPPGVLARQVIEYNLEENTYKSPTFIHALIDQEKVFLDSLVEVKTKEITPS